MYGQYGRSNDKSNAPYTGVQRKMMRSHSSTSTICPLNISEVTTADGSSAVRLVATSSSVSSDVVTVASGFSISSNMLLVYVRIYAILHNLPLFYTSFSFKLLSFRILCRKYESTFGPACLVRSFCRIFCKHGPTITVKVNDLYSLFLAELVEFTK